MKQPILLCFISIVLCGIPSCGMIPEEEFPVFHFRNADLYPIMPEFSTHRMTWSPDGEMVVLSHGRDLWWFSPKTGLSQRFTGMEGLDYWPEWCPANGAGKVVFLNIESSGSDPLNRLCTFNPNEDAPKVIATFNQGIKDPSWSFDGEKIVFLKEKETDRYDYDLCTIPAGGGETYHVPINRLDDSYRITYTQASPVDNSVMFVEEEIHSPYASTFRINSVNLDGGTPATIKRFWGSEKECVCDLDVSYDGAMISYVAYARNGLSYNLYAVPSHSGAEIQITEFWDTHIIIDSPKWAPDGRRMVAKLVLPESSSDSPYRVCVYMIELKL